MNIIEAKDISFGYDEPVLSDVSFHIARNSVTGVIGANGAGKTTLFDLLCKIKKVTSGTLEVHTLYPAYLSQTVSTSPALKLGDMFYMISAIGSERFITMGAAIASLSRWDNALAKRFERLSSRRPAQCSYGEIRYYFALTLLVSNNELILLDEPTAGVDPEHRYFIWEAVLSAKAEGKTIIISSHNLQEIVRNSDVFWFISNRKMTVFGSQEEFLERYGGNDLDHAFIRAGTSP